MVKQRQTALSAHRTSPDATDLSYGAARRRFSPQFEAEFIRARLWDNRTLFPAPCW